MATRRATTPAPRIGVAGWSLPTALKARFPGDGSHLERYARQLRAVEINSSFYRPHQRTTYERWADAVPRDFRFAVKLPRDLTHDAALRAPAKILDTFMAQVAGLGDRLGVLLVQTPASQPRDPRIAARFFAALRQRYDGGVAFEPRHASWFDAAADALLVEHDIARVAADPPRPAAAATPGGSTRLAYWRLHGSPRIYYANYDDDALADYAHRLVAARRTHREVWCIFDNTAHSHAPRNALDLAVRLRGRTLKDRSTTRR